MLKKASWQIKLDSYSVKDTFKEKWQIKSINAVIENEWTLTILMNNIFRTNSGRNIDFVDFLEVFSIKAKKKTKTKL